MSHIEAGFAVTDLEALYDTVASTCPDMEMVAQTTYRTWITDHGSLVGDYALPGVYQVQMLMKAHENGVDVFAAAKAQGVDLPDNLLDLEKNPWTVEDERKLKKSPELMAAYQHINTKVLSKDSQYVIRYKPEHEKSKSAYEIGVVPHPFRTGEYLLLTDYYNSGNGLLTAKGLGGYKKHSDDKTDWGGELKQNYAIAATTRVIEKEIAAGNPEYGSYTVKRHEDTNRVEICVTSR